jgi:hypothetical protein
MEVHQLILKAVQIRLEVLPALVADQLEAVAPLVEVVEAVAEVEVAQESIVVIGQVVK